MFFFAFCCITHELVKGSSFSWKPVHIHLHRNIFSPHQLFFYVVLCPIKKKNEIKRYIPLPLTSFVYLELMAAFISLINLVVSL